MPTTIQVSEHMLIMLKKLKEETNATSYEEALEKSMKKWRIKETLAGFLGKKSSQEIMKGLKDKNDRY